MRTMMMVVATVALVLCSACEPDEREERATPAYPLFITFVSVEYSGGSPIAAYNHYVLRMKLAGSDCVQELKHANQFNSTMSTQFVECFHVGEGDIDTHSGFRGDAREMLIYPASVEGVCMINGWGMLPQNIDGTFVTAQNAVDELGSGYLECDIRGSVTHADMARAITWRFEARADRVHLWIDGVEHPLPSPLS